MDEERKGPYILQSEVEKAVTEMKDKKATGDDDVPEEVLKLMGGNGLKIMTQLIDNIYGTGKYANDLIEATMLAL
jgi:hypothetical protein